MPLQIPNLDDRRYQELLDSALARIPVHTPEWTNFNRSDPGVTLIEVFAFLTEIVALPRQPDPGAQPAQVPVAAWIPPAACLVGQGDRRLLQTPRRAGDGDPQQRA